MKSTAKKLEFIHLKAEGKSNAQIAKLLHVSESTASRYTHLLEEQIAQYKAEQLQELYDTFYMTREARIQQLGGVLARIDDALEQADLSQVTPEKLLDMRLKYFISLKEEYIPLHRPEQMGQMTTAASILQAMGILLVRFQGGDVDPEQTMMEMKVLESMLKGIEMVDIEARLSVIERAIGEGKGR